MIQLQYRATAMTTKQWEVYAESRVITKDMKAFVRQLRNDEDRFNEYRFVKVTATGTVTATLVDGNWIK